MNVDRILHTFLTQQHFNDPRLQQGVTALHDFVLHGGKRLRPLMCCAGYLAATSEGPPETILHAAASLELFHAFALIHDDIMDSSETRRGQPTLHRALIAGGTHRATDAQCRDGIGKAMLLGDLAMVWSDAILHASGLSPQQLAAARPVLDIMRTEVMGGQYLDLAAGNDPEADLETALNVIRFKTAKYTIERPLHLGAALAGADQQLTDELSAYALPLGEAFQLRDDLLGVFGDPHLTGKSDLEDLREGKRTALIALAHRDATPTQRNRLSRLLGDPGLNEEGAHEIRTILTATGARQNIENMISQAHQQVLDHLDTSTRLHPDAVALLRVLADNAVRRST
ncbi:polyprenyl synthetase family protein [Streptomyces sp. NPDC054874]